MSIDYFMEAFYATRNVACAVLLLRNLAERTGDKKLLKTVRPALKEALKAQDLAARRILEDPASTEQQKYFVTQLRCVDAPPAALIAK
jgi:hypothetical protein